MTTTATIRGTTISYQDEGSGPLVIRAHGLTHSRRTDDEIGLIEWRRLVEAGFRVVSYDARGHGLSEGAAESDDYVWASLADDLLALVDHLSPDEPVRAVGISMGTATILTALTIAPHRFAAVALGAPPTAWETRAGQAAVYEELARAAEVKTADELAALLARMPGPPIFDGVQGWPGASAAQHALLPAILRGAGRSDLPDPDALAALDVPALILAWDTDPSHPVSTARRLADLLPGAEMHLSEEAADVATWPRRAADHFRAAGALIG